MMKALVAALLILGFGVPAAAQSVSRECKTSYSLDRLTGRPAAADCLRQPSSVISAQVANGQPAPDERQTAAIFYTGPEGLRHICTGILIDDRHVLTAGHCACGLSWSYVVSLKESALQDDTGKDGLKIEGSPILFDPLACLYGPKPGSDLALLKLAQRVAGMSPSFFGYPSFALAATLRNQMRPNAPLKVVGFGETETGRVAARMKALVPVLTPDCLADPYNLFCAPFLEMILSDRAGDRTARDTCGGDSGGPVFLRTAVSLPKCPLVVADLPKQPIITQQQDVLVGITSRAAPFTHVFGSQHCGGGGIYTLVGRLSVHAWLDANQVKRQICLRDE